MAVTVEDIESRAGRTFDAVETAQVTAWLQDALFLIGRRIDVDEADPDAVDFVVRAAVLAVVQNPAGIESETVSVDDAQITKRYGTAQRRQVTILPEWWAMLGVSGGSAFTVSMLGAGRGGHQPWCSITWGWTCSCGASLTREEYPLWEGGALS